MTEALEALRSEAAAVPGGLPLDVRESYYRGRFDVLFAGEPVVRGARADAARAAFAALGGAFAVLARIRAERGVSARPAADA